MVPRKEDAVQVARLVSRRSLPVPGPMQFLLESVWSYCIRQSLDLLPNWIGTKRVHQYLFVHSALNHMPAALMAGYLGLASPHTARWLEQTKVLTPCLTTYIASKTMSALFVVVEFGGLHSKFWSCETGDVWIMFLPRSSRKPAVFRRVKVLEAKKKRGN